MNFVKKVFVLATIISAVACGVEPISIIYTRMV